MGGWLGGMSEFPPQIFAGSATSCAEPCQRCSNMVSLHPTMNLVGLSIVMRGIQHIIASPNPQVSAFVNFDVRDPNMQQLMLSMKRCFGEISEMMPGKGLGRGALPLHLQAMHCGRHPVTFFSLKFSNISFC